jgi:hypothetical protein
MSYTIDQVMGQAAEYIRREQGADSYHQINCITSEYAHRGEKGKNVLSLIEVGGIEYEIGVNFRQNGRLTPTSIRVRQVDTDVERSLELSDVIVQHDQAA